MVNALAAGLKLIFSGKMGTTEFPPGLSFAGQTVIVTGATSGLGFESAIHYVNLGASAVYIAARNAVKGSEAVAAIEARTGKKGRVHALVLDMDTFSGVQSFVKDVEAEVKTIDVVLLNAGVHMFDFELSPDGWEKDLQVNTLSTMLLGLLLMEWMKSVKKPGQVQHLGFTGSSTLLTLDVQTADFPKKDVLKYFNEEKNVEVGPKTYAISKLLLDFGIRELAKLAIDQDGVPSPIINSMCPGIIKTNLAHGFADKGIIQQAGISVFHWLKAVPADVGARTLVLSATSKAEDNGKFIISHKTDAQYAELSAKNVTSETGHKLQAVVWKEILDVLIGVAPDVAGIAQQKI